MAWKKVLDEEHKTEADAHDVAKITDAKSATDISAEIDGDVTTHTALPAAHHDKYTDDESVAAAESAGFTAIPKEDTAPETPSDGDLWYDTTNGMLMIYST